MENLENVSDTLADNLRYWRTFKGLTQKELADRSGISDRTIAMIERGYVDGNYHAPSLATLVTLCNTLAVRLDELMFYFPSEQVKAS